MACGNYLLGGIAVRIESLYDEVQTMCSDYRTDAEPELTVVTTIEEIEEEGRMSDEERQLEGLPEYHYPLPYLETLAVYRKIATAFLSRGVLLMHGSVVAVDGEGYMFTALSGTGKSTHVALWRQLFGKRAMMVNDDKPLVRIGEGERPVAYGTPWDGKHHLSNNVSVPLKAIAILERGKENSIERLTLEDAFPTLIQQSFRPDDALLAVTSLRLLSRLSQQTPIYRLRCNMHPDAARVAYEGMREQEILSYK